MSIETFNGAFDDAIIWYGKARETQGTSWPLKDHKREGTVNVLYWVSQLKPSGYELLRITNVDYDKLLEWADGKSL